MADITVSSEPINVTDTTGTIPAPVSTSTPAGTEAGLYVRVVSAPASSGTTAVNITQVAGTSIVTGGIAGSQGVGGLAASGATAAGNPNMIGGVFNTTQPTVTNGQVVDLQATARGALIVASGVDAINVTPAANSSVNLNQIGGNSVVTGGTNGSLGVGGLAASGASTVGNPNKIGVVFNTTQPTVTTGQIVDAQGTARGAQIVATGVDAFNINLQQVAGTNTVTGGVAGSQGVGGLAASGAANAGNPEKIGAVFNTTQPTVTNAQVVDLQATARGALIVATGVDVFNAQTIGANLAIGFVDKLNARKVEQPTTLIGDVFGNASTLDANRWSTTLAAGGTVTVSNSEVNLATNTTANGSAILNSLRSARYMIGTVHVYHGIVRLSNTGTANNVRRWGAYDANNGYFFQLNGTTVGIGTRRAAVDTIVTSFNGSAFTLDTSYHTYDIAYTAEEYVEFYQDGLLIHKVSPTTASLVGNPNLPVRMDNTNSAGITTNLSIFALGLGILRYGSPVQRHEFKLVPITVSSTVTTTFKSAPGTLRKILFSKTGNGGSLMSVYDNTAASGTQIASIDLTGAPWGMMDFDIDFTVGLTISVLSGSQAPAATVIYD